MVEHDPDAALWVDRLVATWQADHAAALAEHAQAAVAQREATLQAQGREGLGGGTPEEQAMLEGAVIIDWAKVRQRPADR